MAGYTAWILSDLLGYPEDMFKQGSQKHEGELGGSVVECLTPAREVGGSKPTSTVLCP